MRKFVFDRFSILLKTVAIASSLLFTSCVSPRARISQVPVEPQIVQSEARFRKEYLLAPGDQVEVTVLRVTEVSRTVVIRPDGFISLPAINDVEAAGLTVNELRTKLTELLSARLVNPEVAVIAAQVRQPMVYVQGEVNAPAAVSLRTAPTAMQAIASAGGFRRSAANRDVAIIRLNDDGYLRAIRINAAIHGQPGPYMGLESALLQPDDVIFVPESGRSQFIRLVDDFVNHPVQGINSLVGTYLNFKLIQVVNR